MVDLFTRILTFVHSTFRISALVRQFRFLSGHLSLNFGCFPGVESTGPKLADSFPKRSLRLGVSYSPESSIIWVFDLANLKMQIHWQNAEESKEFLYSTLTWHSLARIHVQCLCQPQMSIVNQFISIFSFAWLSVYGLHLNSVFVHFFIASWSKVVS
jgi:hypothetical protein